MPPTLPLSATAPFRAAYRLADADLRVRQAKLYLILGLVLVPACAGLDYFVYPQLLGRIFVGRLLCDLALLPVLAALYTPWGRAHVTFLCKLVPLAPCATICWMIYATEGVFSPYYAGINLCLVGVTLLIPYTIVEATAICAVVVLFYATACTLHGVVPPATRVRADRPAVTRSSVVNNIYFLGATVVIALSACQYTNRRRVPSSACGTSWTRTTGTWSTPCGGSRRPRSSSSRARR